MSQRICEPLQVIDANLEFGRDLNLIISSIQLERYTGTPVRGGRVRFVDARPRSAGLENSNIEVIGEKWLGMRKWRAPRDDDDDDADDNDDNDDNGDEDDDDADSDDEDDVHDAPFRPSFLPSFLPFCEGQRGGKTRRRQERRANQRGRPLAVSSCGILSAKCSYPGDSARG